MNEDIKKEQNNNKQSNETWNDKKFIVKIADEQWELDEICRLNHQTFTEEIPQHQKTESGLLIDKYHSENKYIICLNDREIVGMLALRDIRPFSLDNKLENLDDYLPPHTKIAEIRLLSIVPKYRNSRVFYYLLKEIFIQTTKHEYDLVVISGVLAQQKLYRSIGFVPFGPLVGDDVKFQPMYNMVEFFLNSRHKHLTTRISQKRINALPGPVNIKKVVSDEFQNIPISHRSDDFIDTYKHITDTLSKLVNAKHTQIFTGSATLANEVMIAKISTLASKGIIISNGEFGNRIINQAKHQNLEFIEYNVGLFNDFDYDEIERIIDENHDLKWLSFVHSETSTGAINNFNKIVELCNKRNILVFVDCVSSFGLMPLDLSKVYLATASSGKAIGSLSGLSIIFYNDLLERSNVKVPVYLDLYYYIQKHGIPFTLNSNALYALGAAARVIDVEQRYNRIKEQTKWLRDQITNLSSNIEIYNSLENHPAIITIKLPPSNNSYLVGKSLEDQNILINFNSEYLRNLNMIQICLFSSVNENDLKHFLEIFKSIIE